MNTRTVQTSMVSGVAELVLDRPDRRNAINAKLVSELADALGRATEDSAVGAILIRGAGESLCSGLDLKDNAMGAIGPEWQTLHRLIARTTTPIVIAHQGAAINAGAALALSADVLVSSETAFLQVMEARLGMTPPVNLAWLLARHSRALTARLTLTAERLTGPELVHSGIAHDCVPDNELIARSRALAAACAAYPQGAGTTIKRLIGRSADPAISFDAILDRLVSS